MGIRFVLSLTFLLFIGAYGGSSASEPAPNTIKIGVSNALTGIYASNGKEELVWPKDQATVPLAYPIPPWKER